MSVPLAPATRRGALLVLSLAVLVGVGVFFLPRPAPAPADSANGLPDRFQSVQVERLQQQLPNTGVEPLLVVVSRADGGRLTSEDLTAVTERRAALVPLAVGGRVPPPQVADDGTVAVLAVPVRAVAGQSERELELAVQQVKAVRSTASADLPSGVRAQVTGGAAFSADLTSVFDGADTNLLLVTLVVVAVLLLITYRSPILWVVPLVVVAAAEQTTLRLVDVVLPRLGLATDGATTGITSVLVFGAATDYALLLIARYREELRRTENRFVAIRSAVGRTAEAIVASGLTVALALLTLLLATVEGNRALGVAGAMGVLVAMVAGLVVLPAALVLAGRTAFWPFVPRAESTGREGRLWGRLGQRVARRPLSIAVAGVVVLAAMATGVLGVRTGLSQTEQFRVKPEAVLGAEVLATAFPAGATQPLAVTTTPAAAERVVAVAREVAGVASAEVGRSGGRVAQVDVVLTAEPGTAASDAAIRDLRARLAAIPD